MNISSAVLHTRADDLGEVKRALAGVPGVEIHAVTDEGRMVITIEGDDARQMGDTLASLHDVKGVLCAAMIYQYCEPELTQEEAAR